MWKKYQNYLTITSDSVINWISTLGILYHKLSGSLSFLTLDRNCFDHLSNYFSPKVSNDLSLLPFIPFMEVKDKRIEKLGRVGSLVPFVSIHSV